MKVILTGDSTPEHFYPLIAIAQELVILIDEKSLADIGIYLYSSNPYDKRMVFENNISFRSVVSGSSKFSLKTLIGIGHALVSVFSVFPDVVVSKGGWSSYPVIFAARLLGIPVIIHESNSIPGDVNVWASKFAYKIAVSFPQVIDVIKREDIIHTGEPILNELKSSTTEGAHEFLNLEKSIPILWIMNGTDTSHTINNVTEESLPALLHDFQIIHQVGETHFEEFKKITDAMLIDHPFKYRYHSFPVLNTLSLKMIAGITDLAILRPDVSLFNIAHWGIPSIIIPNQQSKTEQLPNAYNYARSGSCVVIEENNLNSQSFIFEIHRIYENSDIGFEMSQAAKTFAIPEAGKNIAEEVVGIALAHEK